MATCVFVELFVAATLVWLQDKDSVRSAAYTGELTEIPNRSHLNSRARLDTTSVDLVLQNKARVLEKVLISVSLAWYKPVIPRVLV